MTKEIGALQRVFPCSISRILDHMIAMKEFDYSISDISKITEINFKTTLESVHSLEDQGILKLTRIIGRAKMYQLDKGSPQAKHIEGLAFEIAKRSIAIQAHPQIRQTS